MNWEALHELLDYYEKNIDFLTYSDLVELDDKVTDIQDDVRKKLDAFEGER